MGRCHLHDQHGLDRIARLNLRCHGGKERAVVFTRPAPRVHGGSYEAGCRLARIGLEKVA